MQRDQQAQFAPLSEATARSAGVDGVPRNVVRTASHPGQGCGPWDEASGLAASWSLSESCWKLLCFGVIVRTRTRCRQRSPSGPGGERRVRAPTPSAIARQRWHALTTGCHSPAIRGPPGLVRHNTTHSPGGTRNPHRLFFSLFSDKLPPPAVERFQSKECVRPLPPVPVPSSLERVESRLPALPGLECQACDRQPLSPSPFCPSTGGQTLG